MTLNDYVGFNVASVTATSFWQVKAFTYPYSELTHISHIYTTDGDAQRYEFKFSDGNSWATDNIDSTTLFAQYTEAANFASKQSGTAITVVGP